MEDKPQSSGPEPKGEMIPPSVTSKSNGSRDYSMSAQKSTLVERSLNSFYGWLARRLLGPELSSLLISSSKRKNGSPDRPA